MALQTITILSRSGILDLDTLAVAVDAGATDWWPNTGSEFVYVNNGNAGSLTVTLQYNGPSGSIDGQALTAKTCIFATTKRGLIGPFPTMYYTSQSTGFATLGWSVTATVKVAIVRFTPSG